MYLFFPYVTHNPIQCQTQVAMHPQLHILAIHLKLQTLGGQGKPASIHLIQFKFYSMINGETLYYFSCPKVKEVTPS